MKNGTLFLLFLSFMIGNNIIAQYTQLTSSPCILSFATCNRPQFYLVSDNNRIYLYQNEKCTPSSNNGYDISFSDDDNGTCSSLYGYSGSLYHGAIGTDASLVDSTFIYWTNLVNYNSSIYRLTHQHVITQTLVLPTYSYSKYSATSNNLYALSQRFVPAPTLTTPIYFSKSVNNTTVTDTLNYGNIKGMDSYGNDLPMPFFINDSIGFIVAKDTTSHYILLRTDDYGDRWNLMFSPTNIINDIKFIGDTGIAVGKQGNIYKTIDRGLTWNPLTSFTTKNLNSVSMRLHTMYVAGDSAALYKSTDNGNTWSQELLPFTDKIMWVKTTNTDDVYFQAQKSWGNVLYKKNDDVSVKESKFENGQSLQVHPNPTSGIIDILTTNNLTNKFKVSVINSLGEVVLESNQPSIDLSEVNSGLYSIELKTSAGEIFRSRVVKIDR